MQIDPKGRWQPDDTFLGPARDHPAADALLESIAGKAVAESNRATKNEGAAADHSRLP